MNFKAGSKSDSRTPTRRQGGNRVDTLTNTLRNANQREIVDHPPSTLRIATVLSSETALRATHVYWPESLCRTFSIERVEEILLEYISTLSAFPSRTPFRLQVKETSSPSTIEHAKVTDFPARIRLLCSGSNRTDSATTKSRFECRTQIEFQNFPSQSSRNYPEMR